MHPALIVPELLEKIFEENHDRLAREHRSTHWAGQVCKTWREVALRVRWRVAKLNDVIPILAPWRDEEDGKVFKRRPTIDDWRYFDSIAKRIITLVIQADTALTHALISELQTTRPTPLLDLLPNVKSVVTAPGPVLHRLSQFLPFLPSGLTSIELSIWGSKRIRQAVNDFITLIPYRFQDLRVLSIGHLVESSSLDEALAASLPSMHQLRSITLGGVRLSSAVARALSSAQQLQYVSVGENYGRGVNYDPEEQGDDEHAAYVRTFGLLRWSNQAQAFIGLSTFKVSLGFSSDLAGLLQDMSQTGKLLRLSLGHFHPSVTSAIEMETIAYGVSRHAELADLGITNTKVARLDQPFLRNVGGCASLRRLALRLAVRESSIDDDDMSTLFSKLPLLEDLELRIATDGSPRLTLKTLVYALSHCKSLNIAEILVDATSGSLPTVTCKPHRTFRTFRTPFSLSSVDSPLLVAFFLGQLTEYPLCVQPGFEVQTVEPNRRKQWLEVSDLTLKLWQARRQAANRQILP